MSTFAVIIKEFCEISTFNMINVKDILGVLIECEHPI